MSLLPVPWPVLLQGGIQLVPQALQLAWRAGCGYGLPAALLMQRLGLSLEPGRTACTPCIWFHCSSDGECAVALPVLFRCLQEYNEKVVVLLTTVDPKAYDMLCSSLPRRVIVQMIPIDNAICLGLFMRRWRPTVGILVESPLLPSIVTVAAAWNVKLALLSAHISPSQLLNWHSDKRLRALLARVLPKFQLIVPSTDVDVGRFRILGAGMQQMPGWCNELKYAAILGGSVWHLWKPSDMSMIRLQEGLSGRPVWLAANTQPGEEAVVGRLHVRLAEQLPRLVTVVVPHDPLRCAEVAALLAGEELGLRVALWSERPDTYEGCDVLLVDDPLQLPLLYSVCDVTLMGNSLLEGCTGHSLAEAAVAGTALLVGPHAGASAQVAEELNTAALMAAEEAAAAVRSAGQALDEGGWDTVPDGDRSEGTEGRAMSANASSRAQARPSTAPAPSLTMGTGTPWFSGEQAALNLLHIPRYDDMDTTSLASPDTAASTCVWGMCPPQGMPWGQTGQTADESGGSQWRMGGEDSQVWSCGSYESTCSATEGEARGSGHLLSHASQASAHSVSTVWSPAPPGQQRHRYRDTTSLGSTLSRYMEVQAATCPLLAFSSSLPIRAMTVRPATAVATLAGRRVGAFTQLLDHVTSDALPWHVPGSSRRPRPLTSPANSSPYVAHASITRYPTWDMMTPGAPHSDSAGGAPPSASSARAPHSVSSGGAPRRVSAGGASHTAWLAPPPVNPVRRELNMQTTPSGHRGSRLPSLPVIQSLAGSGEGIVQAGSGAACESPTSTLTVSGATMLGVLWGMRVALSAPHLFTPLQQGSPEPQMLIATPAIQPPPLISKTSSSPKVHPDLLATPLMPMLKLAHSNWSATSDAGSGCMSRTHSYSDLSSLQSGVPPSSCQPWQEPEGHPISSCREQPLSPRGHRQESASLADHPIGSWVPRIPGPALAQNSHTIDEQLSRLQSSLTQQASQPSLNLPTSRSVPPPPRNTSLNTSVNGAGLRAIATGRLPWHVDASADSFPANSASPGSSLPLHMQSSCPPCLGDFGSFEFSPRIALLGRQSNASMRCSAPSQFSCERAGLGRSESMGSVPRPIVAGSSSGLGSPSTFNKSHSSLTSPATAPGTAAVCTPSCTFVLNSQGVLVGNSEEGSPSGIVIGTRWPGLIEKRSSSIESPTNPRVSVAGWMNGPASPPLACATSLPAPGSKHVWPYSRSLDSSNSLQSKLSASSGTSRNGILASAEDALPVSNWFTRQIEVSQSPSAPHVTALSASVVQLPAGSMGPGPGCVFALPQEQASQNGSDMPASLTDLAEGSGGFAVVAEEQSSLSICDLVSPASLTDQGSVAAASPGASCVLEMDEVNLEAAASTGQHVQASLKSPALGVEHLTHRVTRTTSGWGSDEGVPCVPSFADLQGIHVNGKNEVWGVSSAPGAPRASAGATGVRGMTSLAGGSGRLRMLATQPQVRRSSSRVAPPPSPRAPHRLLTHSSSPVNSLGMGTWATSAAGSPRGSGRLELRGSSRAAPSRSQANGCDSQPDTPTSRMSVAHAASSPFTTTSYDRGDPFHTLLTVDSRGTSTNGSGQGTREWTHTALAQLAQASYITSAADGSDSAPDTPTSRLSAMNSVNSPFSTGVYDRPNPFQSNLHRRKLVLGELEPGQAPLCSPLDSSSIPSGQSSSGPGSAGQLDPGQGAQPLAASLATHSVLQARITQRQRVHGATVPTRRGKARFSDQAEPPHSSTVGAHPRGTGFCLPPRHNQAPTGGGTPSTPARRRSDASEFRDLRHFLSSQISLPFPGPRWETPPGSTGHRDAEEEQEGEEPVTPRLSSAATPEGSQSGSLEISGSERAGCQGSVRIPGGSRRSSLGDPNYFLPLSIPLSSSFPSLHLPRRVDWGSTTPDSATTAASVASHAGSFRSNQPLPSPRKNNPGGTSPTRTARRVAYAARTAAMAAGLDMHEALTSVHAPVPGLASTPARDARAPASPVPGLSPRSPYRRLFDDAGQPLPTLLCNTACALTEAEVVGETRASDSPTHHTPTHHDSGISLPGLWGSPDGEGASSGGERDSSLLLSGTVLPSGSAFSEVMAGPSAAYTLALSGHIPPPPQPGLSMDGTSLNTTVMQAQSSEQDLSSDSSTRLSNVHAAEVASFHPDTSASASQLEILTSLRGNPTYDPAVLGVEVLAAWAQAAAASSVAGVIPYESGLLPPGSSPLVISGIHGLMLVCAPSSLIESLSSLTQPSSSTAASPSPQGPFGCSELNSAASTPRGANNSVDDILLPMAMSLPMLRLPAPGTPRGRSRGAGFPNTSVDVPSSAPARVHQQGQGLAAVPEIVSSQSESRQSLSAASGSAVSAFSAAAGGFDCATAVPRQLLSTFVLASSTSSDASLSFHLLSHAPVDPPVRSSAAVAPDTTSTASTTPTLASTVGSMDSVVTALVSTGSVALQNAQDPQPRYEMTDLLPFTFPPPSPTAHSASGRAFAHTYPGRTPAPLISLAPWVAGTTSRNSPLRTTSRASDLPLARHTDILPDTADDQWAGTAGQGRARQAEADHRLHERRSSMGSRDTVQDQIQDQQVLTTRSTTAGISMASSGIMSPVSRAESARSGVPAMLLMERMELSKPENHSFLSQLAPGSPLSPSHLGRRVRYQPFTGTSSPPAAPVPRGRPSTTSPHAGNTPSRRNAVLLNHSKSAGPQVSTHAPMQAAKAAGELQLWGHQSLDGAGSLSGSLPGGRVVPAPPVGPPSAGPPPAPTSVPGPPGGGQPWQQGPTTLTSMWTHRHPGSAKPTPLGLNNKASLAPAQVAPPLHTHQELGLCAQQHSLPTARSHLPFGGRRAFVLPPTQLPRGMAGPAVWRLSSEDETATALLHLLQDPLERRSRGSAAAQAAAKLASGLVHTVWCVLDEVVISPALHTLTTPQP